MLDHALGVKGPCDAGGRQHAAVLAMPEAEDLRGGDLLAEIDEQDAWGQVSGPRFSLGAVLAALRQDFSSQGLEGESLDRRILETMTPILRALANRERRRNATVTKTSCPVIQVGPWAFLVRDEARADNEAASGPAPECVGAVYRDGCSLGVVRYPGAKSPTSRLGPAPARLGSSIRRASSPVGAAARPRPAVRRRPARRKTSGNSQLLSNMCSNPRSNPMSQDFILLATLGRTDVQVVLPIDGKPYRMSVAPASTCAFQEACVSNRIPWNMVPMTACRAVLEKKGLLLDYDDAGGQARAGSPLTVRSDMLLDHDCAAGVELGAALGGDRGPDRGSATSQAARMRPRRGAIVHPSRAAAGR